MQINYTEDGAVQEFSLGGKLDHESYSDFDQLIQSNYQKGQDVILNLEQLTYISSVGLRSFIGLAKLVRNDKKQIKIKATDGSMVKKIILLSGFAKIMPFI